MAKMTVAQKVAKAAADLNAVSVKLNTYSELRKLTDNPAILEEFSSSEKRSKEDVEYLSLKIRGYYAREAPLSKLIAMAGEMFS